MCIRDRFLYQSLKDGNLLGEGTTLEIFIDRDNRVGGSIISSQKVGPSIADDIKTCLLYTSPACQSQQPLHPISNEDLSATFLSLLS